MKTSPVSFGSIMVFTLNDGKPKANTADMVRTSFQYNYDLSDYQLIKTVKYDGEQIDGTVYNSTPSFAKLLDKQYKDLLPKGSKKVILTEADFYINAKNMQKKYFLTAATEDDEAEIHKILGKGIALFAAKFYDKK